MARSFNRSLAPVIALLVAACSSTGAGTTTEGSPTDPSASSGAPGSSGTSGTPGTSGAPGSSGTPGSSGSSGAPGSSGTPGSSGGVAPPVVTVFTIVMENHDYSEIVGSVNAPYLNGLIASYGLATNYMDSGVHPSLPNYLAMISGAPQYPGKVDLLPTNAPFPVTQNNLGTQLEAAKIPWRSYQESMGTPCLLSGATSATGNYAPRHDPFLYFADTQSAALCAKTNVDYSQFAADLATDTYRFMWITPNLTHDGHDPQTNQVTGAKDCDAWASAEIPKIMASAAYKNGGVIFITWDEAEGRSGHSKDQVPMIVVSPNLKTAPFKSAKPYSHKSYLATVEDLLALPRLPTVQTEATMTEFFK